MRDDDDDDEGERDYSDEREDDDEGEDEDEREGEEEEDEEAVGPKTGRASFSQFATKATVPPAPAAVPPAAPAAPPAPAIATPTAAPKKIAAPPCASVTDAAKKKLCLAEAALAKNQAKQKQLTEKLASLSDESTSGEEIDASAKRVANETDSKALASTLASMWKEMRMFDLPFYAEHVEEELHILKQEEANLKTKLKKAKEETKSDKKEKKHAEKGGKKGDKHDKKEMDQLKAPVVEAQKDPAKTASYANFWAMNSKQKEEFFVGSLVYILGSLLFAWIYRQLSQRDSSKQYFLPDARPDLSRLANQRHFSFGLFECFYAPSICILGCCCPAMTWSSTLDRQGYLKFFKAFSVLLMLIVLNSYSYGLSTVGVVVAGVYYRQKLRKTYQIENGSGRTVACDILAWTFCTTCAVIQEAREEAVGAISSDAPWNSDAP